MEVAMRTLLFVLGMAIALSFGSFFKPHVSSAQSAPKDCTAGDGFYSCNFKDETGDGMLGSLTLSSNHNSSSGFFSANLNGSIYSGLCECGLRGSMKNNRPLKENKELLCIGSGKDSQTALAGRVAGNPNNRRAYGQLQLFPFNSTIQSSPGYLFSCKEPTPP